jgi:putative PIG3 family NAD(P)H quinone oxidoreductase
MPEVKAVRIAGSGGPEVLEIREAIVPEPGPGQLLVRVVAAGLNRADCLQRRGFYPAPPGVPADIPGLELAGEVAALGQGVSSWKPGDRVMGIVAGGAMATHVITAADELLPVPDSLSLEEAAAVPEAFFTAYDAIVLQAGLQKGESALFHAVASGIGTAGIQLARAWGATSVGTSRSADKLERCTELGLDHAVLVEEGDFATAVKALLPKGVDVILDTVGAAYLGQNVKVLAKQGRIVIIGLMGGVKSELDIGALLAKRASIRGSVLRSRAPEEKAALTASFARDVLPLFEEGKLRPVIDEVLPMGEIQDAHRRMDANQTFGKIVMTWGAGTARTSSSRPRGSTR